MQQFQFQFEFSTISAPRRVKLNITIAADKRRRTRDDADAISQFGLNTRLLWFWFESTFDWWWTTEWKSVPCHRSRNYAGNSINGTKTTLDYPVPTLSTIIDDPPSRDLIKKLVLAEHINNDVIKQFNGLIFVVIAALIHQTQAGLGRKCATRRRRLQRNLGHVARGGTGAAATMKWRNCGQELPCDN